MSRFREETMPILCLLAVIAIMVGCCRDREPEIRQEQYIHCKKVAPDSYHRAVYRCDDNEAICYLTDYGISCVGRK